MSFYITPEAFNRIATLSKKQNTTIQNRVMKLSEEVGEVAGAVLKYTEAPGCTYRTATADNVVEEVIDVMLVAMSLLYELKGVTQEDLEDVLGDKLLKWSAALQQTDDIFQPTFPHEIHITVSPTQHQTIEQFVDVCRNMGCKPVLIELQRDLQSVGDDLMTSYTVESTTADAIFIMLSQAATLSKAGFKVTRKKIETVPWHPDVPQHVDDHHEGYFETHVPVVISDTRFTRGTVFEICEKHSVHLSRNKFKQLDGDRYVGMCTMRSYTDTASSFQLKVEAFTNDLTKNNVTINKKALIEYALYDSNEQSDDRWIKNGR